MAAWTDHVKVVHFLEVVAQRYSEGQALKVCVDLMTESQLDEAAHHLGIKWNVPADAQPVIQPAEIRMIVHISDTIKLEGKHKTARDFLTSYGYWWKIAGVHHPDPGKVGMAQTSRPPSWFLKSVPAKKQGGIGKSTSENLWLIKDNDTDYRIVEVCAFPLEFNFKNYK